MPASRWSVRKEGEPDEHLFALADGQRRIVVGTVFSGKPGAHVGTGTAQLWFDAGHEDVIERISVQRGQRANRDRRTPRRLRWCLYRSAPRLVQRQPGWIVERPQQQDVVAVDHRGVRS